MLHVTDVLMAEREKYDEIWSFPEYREFSPGMQNVERFMSIIKPKAGETLVDIGCGTGEAGLAFEGHGLRVSWVDLTDAALSSDIEPYQFTKSAIWDWRWTRKRSLRWDYCFCCDVLEHIPVEFTMLSLERIIQSGRISWLQIAFEPDAFGALIGKPLHLTVQPFEWWRDRIASMGNLIDARDLCGAGLFVVKR